jgi:HEXXH motif-containing protein
MSAWELLERSWNDVIVWLRSLIPAFVDLGIPPEGLSFSASYESGGPIFLSRVSDYCLHAEDLVHELQHHRLLIFASSAHFKSWDEPACRFISPYRPDPRPLRGVIIGLHAFLAVNDLRRRLIEDGRRTDELIRQTVDLHHRNLFAFRTIIEYEKFSEIGRRLIKEMGAAIATHHAMIRSLEGECQPNEAFSSHLEIVGDEARRIGVDLQNDSPMFLDRNKSAYLAGAYI